MSLIKELLKINPEKNDQGLGQVDDLIDTISLGVPTSLATEATKPISEAKRSKPVDLPSEIPYVDDEMRDSSELKSLAKRHPEAIQAMMNWN